MKLSLSVLSLRIPQVTDDTNGIQYGLSLCMQDCMSYCTLIAHIPCILKVPRDSSSKLID